MKSKWKQDFTLRSDAYLNITCTKYLLALCFSSLRSVSSSLLSPPRSLLQQHRPPFVCSRALATPRRSGVMRLTVTNKLRPHREPLILLSPAAGLRVRAYVHSGNNPITILFLIYSWSAGLFLFFLFATLPLQCRPDGGNLWLHHHCIFAHMLLSWKLENISLQCLISACFYQDSSRYSVQ